MTGPIGADELRAAIERGGVYVWDMRTPEQYLERHIPGARHLPHSQVVRWVPQRCGTQDVVVLYDDDGSRGGPAREACLELAHAWFRNLRYLAGGFAAWAAAGHPVENGGEAGPRALSRDGELPLFQQSAVVDWATPKGIDPLARDQA